MSGSRYVTPFAFATDGTGTPYAGGQLFFYASGTTTPQTTYADAGLTVPNPNPVPANSAGVWPSIFLTTSPYKVVFEDANGNQVWTADPVLQPASGGGSTGTMPVGAVIPWAGPQNNPSYPLPTGWLLCYGQAVSRTTYAALFAAIGTLWGAGDGSTTFNLPDLRGRALFGADNMGGTAAGRLTSASMGAAATPGVTGGSELLAAHAHSITDPGHSHVAQLGTISVAAGVNVEDVPNSSGGISTYSTETATTGITATNSDGSGNSQNTPPAAVIQWIIYAS